MGLFRRGNKDTKEERFAGDSTYVIVGLGNPGAEYEKTRHNMGFRALDVLASDAGIEIRRAKFHALLGQGRIGSRKVILVKPQTYMNRSGIAVREAAMYYDVPSCNVIVIYDDIDLPAASIRIRKSGGPGTHNGMRSVVEQLGTQDFPRIRIGVGAAQGNEDLVDRVIGKVPKEEQEILDKAAADAAKAAYDIVALGIDMAMNRHNHSPAKAKKAKKEKEQAEQAAPADGNANEQATAPTADNNVSEPAAAPAVDNTGSEPAPTVTE